MCGSLVAAASSCLYSAPARVRKHTDVGSRRTCHVPGLELKWLSVKRGEHRMPALLATNPSGKVPFLVEYDTPPSATHPGSAAAAPAAKPPSPAPSAAAPERPAGGAAGGAGAAAPRSARTPSSSALAASQAGPAGGNSVSRPGRGAAPEPAQAPPPTAAGVLGASSSGSSSNPTSPRAAACTGSNREYAAPLSPHAPPTLHSSPPAFGPPAAAVPLDAVPASAPVPAASPAPVAHDTSPQTAPSHAQASEGRPSPGPLGQLPATNSNYASHDSCTLAASLLVCICVANVHVHVCMARRGGDVDEDESVYGCG